MLVDVHGGPRVWVLGRLRLIGTARRLSNRRGRPIDQARTRAGQHGQGEGRQVDRPRPPGSWNRPAAGRATDGSPRPWSSQRTGPGNTARAQRPVRAERRRRAASAERDVDAACAAPASRLTSITDQRPSGAPQRIGDHERPALGVGRPGGRGVEAGAAGRPARPSRPASSARRSRPASASARGRRRPPGKHHVAVAGAGKRLVRRAVPADSRTCRRPYRRRRLRNSPTMSAAKSALGSSDIARPEKGEKPYSLIIQGIEVGTPLAPSRPGRGPSAGLVAQQRPERPRRRPRRRSARRRRTAAGRGRRAPSARRRSGAPSRRPPRCRAKAGDRPLHAGAAEPSPAGRRRASRWRSPDRGRHSPRADELAVRLLAELHLPLTGQPRRSM